MVKSKKADEIPLLEKEDESFSKISGERRRNRPEANGDPPISAPLVETISYTVLPDDTLEVSLDQKVKVLFNHFRQYH